MKEKFDIERYISEISDTLISAFQNWEIWWLYKQERPKYVDTMNSYLGFFSNSVRAHFISVLMSISCLIDTKYISITSLYNKLKETSQLDEKVIIVIDSKFSSIDYIIKGIKIIRSNVFAHISSKIDSEEAFIKAGLKYDDIKDIIIELGNIFNLLRISSGKNQLGFWINSSKPDIERLLENLKT